MATLKTKKELSTDAETLAKSYSLIRYVNTIYIPKDFETGDQDVTPPPERTVWAPMSRDEIRVIARDKFDTLFETEAQLASFHFMVGQCSAQYAEKVDSLLVRTEQGLKQLRPDGKLYDPPGTFIPNTLLPVLNEDEEDKETVRKLIVEWVDSEEEAQALIRHLATALAPHWSAVKYMLLLGDGRNGKSLLMHMLTRIFGTENCSSVSRQDISEGSPVVTQLNGKLLNIVFDGMAVYLKDSGREKSLIAGETVGVRLLYSSTPTEVQTNALFIEGLNREPKTTDKSSALQARIVRFWFPNVYDEDRMFWTKMTSDTYVGALLSLLIDNYVEQKDAAVMLAPTSGSVQLRMEHLFENSIALQYLKHLEDTQPMGAQGLLGEEFVELVKGFNSWRLREMNDVSSWSEPDLIALFRPVLHTERKSKRVHGAPRKVRFVTTFTKETLLFLQTFIEKEEEDVTALVED